MKWHNELEKTKCHSRACPSGVSQYMMSRKRATRLRGPFVKEFDITGRSMKGWIMVEPDGFTDDAYLTEWVKQAFGIVKTRPAK